MKQRPAKIVPSLVANPFVSEAQRAACHAADDPDWDCDEWERRTPDKRLPKRKPTTNAKKRRTSKRKNYDPTRTLSMRQAFVKQVRKRFQTLKGRLYQLIVTEDAFGLKEAKPLTFNCDPNRLIEVPDVRQPNEFYCGAAATRGVALLRGLEPGTIQRVAGELGTSVEKSTHPSAVVDYFRRRGVAVEAREGLGIADLARYHQLGWPVIVPVQDYMGRRDPEAEFDYGHWLTVIGVGLGYVFCQDSSLENWERVEGGDVPRSKQQPGNIDAPGRIMVREQDFLDVWHDKDAEGKPYVHYGIAVGPKLAANAFCPTGDGGGIDPSCSPGAGGAATGNKVVGRDGKPLTMFHGTDENFQSFKDGVTYFSPSPRYSYVWHGPKVIEAEVRMENPYHTEHLTDVEGAAYQADWVKELKEKGYDGIIYSKSGNLLKGPSGWGNDYPQYVVFSKDQIHVKAKHDNQDFRDKIQSGDIAANVFCPTGPGGGVDASCAPGGVGASHDSKAGQVLAFARGLPAKAMGRIRAQVQAKYAKLSARYGPTYAKAIIGAALVGLPVPLPGASLASASVVIAIAELHRLVTGHGTHNVEDGFSMTQAEIEAAAKKLIAELRREFGTTENAKITGLRRVESGLHEYTHPSGSKFIIHKSEEGKWLVSEKNGPTPYHHGPPFDAAATLEEAVSYVRLRDEKGRFTSNATQQFAFHSSPEQLKQFQAWLRRQYKSLLTGKTEEELWQVYAEQGFKRGAGRAFDDVNSGYYAGKASKEGAPDFMAGGRDQFLRSAFGRPESVEKIQLLASRSFLDLVNVTEDMATKMGRVLVDGLTQGMNPRAIADDMDDVLDVGLARADVIARTEIIRAHAEGQLDAFDKLGVAEIGVEVEWSTAGDERVCPECEDLEGKIFSVEDAHGMIPLHPNCRCAFLPVIPEELTK